MIQNNTDQPIAVDLYAETFTVGNYSYSYTFSETSSQDQWIRFGQPSLTLPAHGSQSVGYTIAVPTSATPGSTYFSLFAATSNQSTNGGIAVSERVGSLLYVTIPGNSSYTGDLLGLDAPTVAFSAINWSERYITPARITSAVLIRFR